LEATVSGRSQACVALGAVILGAIASTIACAAVFGLDETTLRGGPNRDARENDGTTEADTAGGDGTVPSADAACTSWSNDYCNKLSACHATAVTFLYGDVPTCKTRTKLDCMRTLGAVGTGYSPADKIVACGTAISTMLCPALSSGVHPPECSLPGTFGPGMACGANAQCASRFCKLGLDSWCGHCATLAPTKGEPCFEKQCGDDLTCVSGVCQKQGVLDDFCDVAQPCSAAFFCSSSNKCVNPVLLEGKPCDVTGCAYLDGLYCNSAKMCQRVGLAKPGEACGTLATALTVCAAVGVCKIPSGTTGMCVGSVVEPAACNDATGPRCLAPAACITSTCALSDPSACK
jgi:hypothetical protein